jgi:hypothetical protein
MGVNYWAGTGRPAALDALAAAMQSGEAVMGRSRGDTMFMKHEPR